MSRFNVCIRKVLRATGEHPSHAFIQFHWCIESQSRLTGEPFCQLFQRLGQKFQFGRNPENWPTAQQLQTAGQELLREREHYIAELARLVEQRRREKRQGQREGRDKTLEQMEARRLGHNLKAPRLGCWGWKLARSKASSAPL